jgi:hypothetical protein
MSVDSGTKRERRLAAREDRKRRAATAQQRARFRRLGLIAFAILLVAGLAVAAFTTSFFGLMAPSIGRPIPTEGADHVPDGTALTYRSRPPTSGPHYAAWYPTYGAVTEPVSPGNWVHNLEHGAVVLLYNCPEGCPELVQQIRTLHSTLPLGRNARRGVPRMLALPYTDMDSRIAVVAWGYLLELDEFDAEQIRRFYEARIDRGPECQNLACPD